MRNRILVLAAVGTALLAAGFTAGRVNAESGGTVYELRTYVCLEGKLPDLLARFRNHTTALFEKHGMENVGYWVPSDGPQSKTTLIYVLRHKSRAAAKASWDAFRTDPEWVRVRAESEAKGKIVDHVDSVFMEPTDFSKLK
jgi:hypothetical protein